MKFLGFVFLGFLTVVETKAQVFSSNQVAVHFFSPAPVTDIDALTNNASAIINAKKKEVKVSIPVTSFSFKKALMQQHFNEIYLETDKHPLSTFKGIYKEIIDLTVNGEYKINLTGKLNLHGVDKALTLPCHLIVKNKEITFNTDFRLFTKDFKITVPTILNKEVGKEIYVTVNGILKKL